jgi:hypothetical protein
MSAKMTMVDDLQKIQQLREAVEQAQEKEFQEQIRKHEMQVEQIRSATRFRKGKGSTTPLDFLAIGDSWFRYPLYENIPTLDNYGIARQLEQLGDPNPIVLNLAWPGYASTDVLSYKNQKTIISLLQNHSRWVNGTGPDAILVSMGGNDLVGDKFAIYLEYGGTQKSLSDRFQGALDLVIASYEDLFELRHLFARDVPIFAHCYDHPLPSGVPAALIMGPWLWPSLKFALYDYNHAKDVVAAMVDKFYETLNTLAAKTKNFYLVDTRNILTRDDTYPKGWSNELHPHTAGFTALAEKFLADLKPHFIGRI